MTADDVKQLAQLAGEKKARWEAVHGTYDCKASMMAAYHFAHLAQAITADDEIKFLTLLFEKINAVKANMQGEFAGELNGGKGTLLSCYNTLEELS